MSKGILIGNNFYLLGIFITYFLIIDFALTRGLRLKNKVHLFEKNSKIGYIFKANKSLRSNKPFETFSHLSFTDKNNNKKSIFQKLCVDKYSFLNQYAKVPNYNTIIVGDHKLSALNIDDEKNYVSIINKTCPNKLLVFNGGLDFQKEEFSLLNLQRIKNLGLLRKENVNNYVLMLSRSNFTEDKNFDRNYFLNYLNRDINKDDFPIKKLNQLGNKIEDLLRDNLSITYAVQYEIKKYFYNFHKRNFSLNKKNYIYTNKCKDIIEKIKSNLDSTDLEKIIIGVHTDIDSRRFNLINTSKFEKCLDNYSYAYKNIEVLPLYETARYIFKEKYTKNDFSIKNYKEKEHEIIANSLMQLLRTLKVSENYLGGLKEWNTDMEIDADFILDAEAKKLLD